MSAEEEIISMLSNLGALDGKKAVSIELLGNSERLKGVPIEQHIKSLQVKGYVKQSEDKKAYLTESGLVRALSRFS